MIYVTDMDNTFLHDTGILTEYSKDVLNELIQNGLQFTVASARSVFSIQKILHGVNLKLPVIELNGGFISDFNTGDHIITNHIDAEIVSSVLDTVRKYGNEPFLSTFNGLQDKLYYERIHNYGMQWYLDERIKLRDNRLQYTTDLGKCLQEKVISLTIINKKEYLTLLRDEILDRYKGLLNTHLMENSYSKGWYWLTLHNINASKGIAVQQLINLQGFLLKDLVVFGDNVNDIEMFKISPRTVAVSNATSELKVIAQEIIGNNNDDSVVNYIKKDFLTQIMNAQKR